MKPELICAGATADGTVAAPASVVRTTKAVAAVTASADRTATAVRVGRTAAPDGRNRHRSMSIKRPAACAVNRYPPVACVLVALGQHREAVAQAHGGACDTGTDGLRRDGGRFRVVHDVVEDERENQPAHELPEHRRVTPSMRVGGGRRTLCAG